jgi:hypothetical protein
MFTRQTRSRPSNPRRPDAPSAIITIKMAARLGPKAASGKVNEIGKEIRPREARAAGTQNARILITPTTCWGNA